MTRAKEVHQLEIIATEQEIERESARTRSKRAFQPFSIACVCITIQVRMYDLAPSSREGARILAEAETKSSRELASVHVNGGTSSAHHHQNSSKSVDPYSALLLKEATRAHGDGKKASPPHSAPAVTATAVADRSAAAIGGRGASKQSSAGVPSSPPLPPVSVTCLASSALLGLLVTGGSDGSLRLWDSEFLSLEAHLPLAVATRRMQALALLRQDHAEAMAHSDRAKSRQKTNNDPSNANNNNNNGYGSSSSSSSSLTGRSRPPTAAYSGTVGLKAPRQESVEELKEHSTKRNATQKLPVGRAARAAAKADKARLAEKARRAAMSEEERRAEDEAKEAESQANSAAASNYLAPGASVNGSVSAGSGASSIGANASASSPQSHAQKRVAAQRRRSSLALAQLTAATSSSSNLLLEANNDLQPVTELPTPTSVRSSSGSSLMPDSPVAMGWGGPLSPTFNGQLLNSNNNSGATTDWPGAIKPLAPTPLPVAPLWEEEGGDEREDEAGGLADTLNMPSVGSEPESTAMHSLDLANFSVITSAEVSIAPSMEAAPVPASTKSRSSKGGSVSRGFGTAGSAAAGSAAAGHSDVEPPTV